MHIVAYRIVVTKQVCACMDVCAVTESFFSKLTVLKKQKTDNTIHLHALCCTNLHTHIISCVCALVPSPIFFAAPAATTTTATAATASAIVPSLSPPLPPPSLPLL
eukprot:GDKI01025333.1.p2 GENE.GDKI01025333.1~~GDKI01025333.1.p2  ORF type:complete len:106 (-),score=26.59 GDKI01025333.1:61-378(-)